MHIVFNSLVSSLVFIFIFYNLNLIKLKYKDFIVLAIINFSVTYVRFVVNTSLGLPIIFVLSMIYLFFKNKKIIMNVISVLLTIIITLTVDMMCGYAFLGVLNISLKDLFENSNLYSILHLTVLIVSILISKLIGALIKRINISEQLEKINTKLTVLVLTNMISAAMVMYMLAMINRFVNTSDFVVILNVFLFIIYFASTMSITIFYGNYVKKDILYKHRKEEFKQLQKYTDMLERMYNDGRKFKHDYINIITTINGYIEENNISELEKYFNENIIPLSRTIDSNNAKLGLLQHIKVIGLKGLLSSKIIQAQNKKIDVYIDICEDIVRMDMDIIDLCRITGILFDNAIEAASKCKDPIIKFGVINKKHSVAMVIINSCEIDLPPIYKMFEEGFSTKGINRGLGLSTVKQIVDMQYKNVTLNTCIENDLFKQELIIKFKNKESEEFFNYKNIS